MFQRLAPLSMLALSVACGSVRKYEIYNDSDTGSTESQASSLEPFGTIELDSVVPAFGSNAGGSEVILRGGPFDRFTEVTFGDVEGEVLSAEADELVVRVPRVDMDGDVALVVRSDIGSAVGSFRYWPDATGLVGLKGTLAYVNVVGDYWTSSAADRALVELALVEPVAYEPWQDLAPTFGGCASDWGARPDRTVDGAATVTLVSSSTSVDIDVDSDGWYQADGGVTPGQSYDFEPSSDWAGLSVPDLVQVPVGLRVVEPALDVAVPPKVDRSFDITWDRSDSADYVAVVLERASWDANSGAPVIQQKVTCAVPDNGSFTVPGELWSAWVPDEVIFVSVGRVKVSDGVLPHNGSSIAVTGAYWVAGAVRSR